jgi:hypothetical protein
MDSMTKQELIAICKEKGVKKYSGKNKEDLIQMIHAVASQQTKKDRGQFYTTRSDYILTGFAPPPATARCIAEPFAGKGDLLDWISKTGCTLPVEAYDIEPKRDGIQQRDTLKSPPNYADSWIITNPPYLARNKSAKKDIYDMYDTNDLYKCFINSVVSQGNACGGLFIIPAGFFFSPRDLDGRCRRDFMRRFRITLVKYFEETVFDDTTTTIVAFSFERSPTLMDHQDVEWRIFPSGQSKIFRMSAANDWIIGGDIYDLSTPDTISVRRHVEGNPLKEGEQQTFMTLNALDSGTADGRICLSYKKDYIYPAKDCSRTYATLRLTGIRLTEADQIAICEAFNTFIEQKRGEYWSLFLPQFRESKEYARKRIPFELAYRIVLHIIQQRS